jgi:hypothetical protein
MDENKSSISQAQSYRKIGEFWDTHDLADYWAQTEPAEFDVDIQSEARYYALESDLVAKVSEIAWRRGVSVETLLNLWVQEKLMDSDVLPEQVTQPVSTA